jgi:hypothetical protein
MQKLKKSTKKPTKKSIPKPVKSPKKVTKKVTKNKKIPSSKKSNKIKEHKEIKTLVKFIPIIQEPEKKKRKKNPTRMYFTQHTEDAISRYNTEKDDIEREKIFEDEILFPFQKLVENVFNTFKFSYFETGPQDVQKECLSHLVANIDKYQKDKGKAFSYFSIIAKHYFILLNNTNYKKFNQNMEISEDRDENTIQLQHTDKHYVQQELSDFIKLMVEFWENNIQRIFSKQRDLNIANAVVELFRNSDKIDAYNKKALYLYIREMARCKTQQITKVINKMKIYHDNIQESYLNSGNINTTKYS